MFLLMLGIGCEGRAARGATSYLNGGQALMPVLGSTWRRGGQARVPVLHGESCKCCVIRGSLGGVIGDDAGLTRRHLPHMQYGGKTYFVTFVTRGRFVLPEAARDIALDTIVFEHRRSCYLHCAVVMPDHVHALFTPLEEWTVPRIERRMKGLSAWRINGLLSRSGALWLSESFDRALRCDEDLVRKADYICANPVRAGIVEHEDEYKWLWRAWKHEEDRHECLSSMENESNGR